MIKEIEYTGYEAATPDNLASDGSLSVAIGLVKQDGGMRAATPPNAKIKIPDGYEIVFKHRVSSGQINTILRKGQTFSWFQYDYEEVVEDDFTDEIEANKFMLSFPIEQAGSPLKALRNFTDINAVGNTLIILYGTPFYVLWKDKKYNVLGSHIPTMHISFGLQGNFVKEPTENTWKAADASYPFDYVYFDTDPMYVYYSDTEYTNFDYPISNSSLATKISEHIQARLNPLINKYADEKGKFVHPFFLQYALRMYDGTRVCRSVPIFMLPTIYPLPVDMIKGENHIKEEIKQHTGYVNQAKRCFLYEILMPNLDIDYQIRLDTNIFGLTTIEQYIEEIKKWGDIIQCIDIFVSKPIYFYEQSFTGKGWTGERDKCMSYFNGKFTDCADDIYCSHNISKICKVSGDRSTAIVTENFFDIPIDEEKAKNRMCGENPCYLVASINISDINEDMFLKRNVLKVDIEKKKNLTEQSACETDADYDYYDNDELFATNIEVYNNVCSLYGLNRHLFNGFCLDTSIAFCNKFSQEEDFGSSKQSIYVKIENEDGTVCVLGNSSHVSMCNFPLDDVTVKHFWGNYISFPNPNAKYMWIGNVYRGFTKIKLTKDSHWNRAYAYLGIYSGHPINASYSDILSEIEDSDRYGFVKLGNIVYSSITNNPFVFRPSRAISFDGADVIGMASATKALSQGQFGQFPMYAFTSDGIWALEVSASTGGYSAKQPVTRDVCINPLSITQGDDCIYFVSDRGLMLLIGSETACISDVLDDHFAQSLKDILPGYGKFLGIAGVDEKSAAMPAFREFIKEAQIVYDYPNQRVIVFRPLADGEEENIAFTYSLLSKTWSTMPCSLTGKINSYPDALAVMNGKGIVNLSTITDGTKGTGMLVTRPLSLDAPEVHKTVDTIIQRGKFRKGCIKQALWGSRDLIHWHLVASSNSHILRHVHGTPFKWFRVGVIATLKDDETLTGCSISYTPKLMNKLR